MLVGKQKAAFRLKITDAQNNKSKTITVYQGKEKKSLEQFYKEIMNFLRTKD